MVYTQGMLNYNKYFIFLYRYIIIIMNSNNPPPQKNDSKKNDSKKYNTNNSYKKKSIPKVDSLNTILNENLFFFSS